MKLFSRIEAGGTKFVCLVGNCPDQLVEEKRFPTTLHGLIHTEGGHLATPHNFQKAPLQGVCPYHADHLEGLVSGRR